MDEENLKRTLFHTIIIQSRITYLVNHKSYNFQGTSILPYLNGINIKLFHSIHYAKCNANEHELPFS